MSRKPASSVGERIKELREELGLSLSELSREASVSKSYLWALENESKRQRPSGETLYAIAQALGTTMSDLLGRRLLTDPDGEIPTSLQQFAEDEGLPEGDVRMLASIQWRGSPPQTVERWRFVYNALKTSQSLER